MEAITRFVLAVVKIAAGVTVAALLVALVIWGVSEYLESRDRATNAPLAEKKVWPKSTIEPLGVSLELATMWRDSKIYYRLDISGYSEALETGRAGSGRFIFEFLTSDGFRVFEKSVPVGDMSQAVNAKYEPNGLSWTGDEYLGVDSYRTAQLLKVKFAGFDAPKALTATPRRAPAAAGRSQWRDRSRWRQLRVGMSEDDVRFLLGEPDRIITIGSSRNWQYGSAVDGSLWFDQKGVSQWSEP